VYLQNLQYVAYIKNTKNNLPQYYMM